MKIFLSPATFVQEVLRGRKFWDLVGFSGSGFFRMNCFITLNGLLVEVLRGLDGRRVGPLGGLSIVITSGSGLFQFLPHEGGLLTLPTLRTRAGRRPLLELLLLLLLLLLLGDQLLLICRGDHENRLTILGNLWSVGQLVFNAAVDKQRLGVVLARVGVHKTSRGGLDTACS